MKEIIVTGFKDKTADYLFGKEISTHSLSNSHELVEARNLMTKLSLADKKLFNKKVLARTMYVPPIHMRTFNDTEYVLLMPWLNLINGIFDKRNFPWMQHAQSSITEGYYRSSQTVYALQVILRAFTSDYRIDPEGSFVKESNLSDNTKKLIFNDVVNQVNLSVIPSWMLSSLLFHNQLIHGRVNYNLQSFNTMKAIPKIVFKMGGRKIDTMYRGILTDGSPQIQFFNSLEMFLTPIRNDFSYRNNVGNSINPQSNFETYTAYQGKFIELGINILRRMNIESSTRLTDEFQITPLITPVIKRGDLYMILNKIRDTFGTSRSPIINRDLIKFNVYNSMFNGTKTSSSLRIKALRDRNIRRLESVGCNIDYIEHDTKETDYLGGFTNISALPTEITSEGCIRSFTSMGKVAVDHIRNVSGNNSMAGKVDVKNISNIDVIDWLLKFGDTHVPLLNYINT